ncbi:MAG: 3-deoxy-7-phosphoheptulonate synthase, partial [Shewanella fodinae]|nr:3-deoxy-7-phosphoheptulonate synthase [Shewanella fodinae]
PNYDADSVAQSAEALHKAGLTARLIIDCSHGNSSKDHRRQPLVCREIFQQIIDGNKSIIGVMLESHLFEGNQKCDKPLSELQYGVSVTDACIDWLATESLLRQGAEQLASILPGRFDMLRAANA